MKPEQDGVEKSGDEEGGENQGSVEVVQGGVVVRVSLDTVIWIRSKYHSGSFVSGGDVLLKSDKLQSCEHLRIVEVLEMNSRKRINSKNENMIKICVVATTTSISMLM